MIITTVKLIVYGACHDDILTNAAEAIKEYVNGWASESTSVSNYEIFVSTNENFDDVSNQYRGEVIARVKDE
jgi:hypothetical protein